MSEAQPGGLQPETGSDFFSIEGEGRRFFLDKGEELTENPEGIKEFGGFINFVGDDGKAEKFPGGIFDRGDYWQVLRFDGVADEYLIPKGGGTPEVRQEAGEGVLAAPAEEAVVGGLEDAAAVEAVKSPSVAEPEPQPTPEPAVELVPSLTPETAEAKGLTEENRYPLVVELQQKMRAVYRPLRAVRLWKQAENATAGAERTRSRAKIGELFTQWGELKRQAKELYPDIEKMADEEREELLRKTVPLSAEGTAGEIRISSPRHREDMAAFYETELSKWENALRDAGDFEHYQAVRAEVESQKDAARQLFSEESDRRLLDQAIARIEQRGSGRLKELGTRLPRRLLELAGFIPGESPTLGQAESDMDLRLAYNRAAERLYAELMGQPPSAPEMPAAAPEPMAPLEPVVEPVIEPTAESMVESAVEAAAPPAEEVAPPPVEEPVEAPVEAAPVSPVEEAPGVPVEVPMPEAPAQAEAAPASAEASAGEAETPEQRFERRKQGFAGALAELDKARNDTSGTEGEQKVRLAEAFNQAIGAAMEFMEEGDEARVVVKEFLAGALGTPGGRKLTEIAVKSRMDNAGVLQAATPEERKKKLEEAGLLGLLTLLLELGMSFTDVSVQAVVSEVQSVTGGGR